MMGALPRRECLRASLAALLGVAGLPARGGQDATQPASPAATRRTPEAALLPAPGSYRLPRLGRAPDGQVLTADGRAHHLHGLLAGRHTVLSFMYTYCRDPVGCPLAWQVMQAVHQKLRADPALAPRAQLISLSFDPTHDTPQQMALMGGSRLDDMQARWLFLTTASVARLMPLLQGFGQDVSVELDAQGRPTRTLNHLLRVFLVDAAWQMREIYSVATVDPQAILHDLRTLQLEATGRGAPGRALR